MVKTLCKKPCGEKGEHQGRNLKSRYAVQSLRESWMLITTTETTTGKFEVWQNVLKRKF